MTCKDLIDILSEYLEEALSLGQRLVVGINSDASVRRLKGPSRPIVPEAERRELVGALACVDDALVFAVTLYEEWKWTDMFIVPRRKIEQVVKPA